MTSMWPPLKETVRPIWRSQFPIRKRTSGARQWLPIRAATYSSSFRWRPGKVSGGIRSPQALGSVLGMVVDTHRISAGLKPVAEYRARFMRESMRMIKSCVSVGSSDKKMDSASWRGKRLPKNSSTRPLKDVLGVVCIGPPDS